MEIKWLNWPLKNIPFLWFEKLLGCFCSMMWVITNFHYKMLSDRFCKIWLDPRTVHFRIHSSLHVPELNQVFAPCCKHSLFTFMTTSLSPPEFSWFCQMLGFKKKKKKKTKERILWSLTVFHTRWCCRAGESFPSFYIPVVTTSPIIILTSQSKWSLASKSPWTSHWEFQCRDTKCKFKSWN